MLEVNVIDERWCNIIENPEDFVLNVINVSLKELKIDHYKLNISIALAGDNLLHQLNLKFRKIDKPTNVLSFPCEQLSNRSLAKPVYDEKFLGESQMSTAEYSNVFEERNQVSTTKLPSETELCKGSNECDLGDIAISIDTIERESEEYSIPIFAHVAHMLIHGLLHLLGYDHQEEDEEVIMKELEGKILFSLGYNI